MESIKEEEDGRDTPTGDPLRITALCDAAIPELSKPFRFKALPPKSIKIE